MSRKKHYGPKNAKGPLTKRANARLTPAQREACVRTYFTMGSITGTAAAMGVSTNAVRHALRELHDDPALMAARGQALDQMAGRIHAITEQVIDSITPEELITTRREMRDNAGNLLRVVIDGPSLKDKALTIGILADKQRVLIEAKAKATENNTFQMAKNVLMLPEDIREKELLVANLVKKLRVTEVYMRDEDSQKNVNRMLSKVGITETDIAEAEFEPMDSVAPFD
jgi:hypothetical protein